MAVMKTEEYDFLISSVMPEFEADAKIHDPSRLHLGYWRVTDRLEFDALDNATGADEKDTEKKERLDLFPKSGMNSSLGASSSTLNLRMVVLL
jgi:hypothetical protein